MLSAITIGMSDRLQQPQVSLALCGLLSGIHNCAHASSTSIVRDFDIATASVLS